MQRLSMSVDIINWHFSATCTYICLVKHHVTSQVVEIILYVKVQKIRHWLCRFLKPCKISKIFGKSLWENVNFLDPCKHKFLDRRRGVLTLFLYGHVTFFDRFIVSSCNECFDKYFISLVIFSDQGQKSVEATFQKTGFLKKKLEFWPDFPI